MKCYMLSDYLKDTYGEKIYKLKLSSGMTCPNRDGKCGTRGCIFCSEKGSGEFVADSRLSIEQQIEEEKLKVPTISGKYIAYFQNFTNTYDTPENVRRIYRPVALRDDIAILSVATRPDCLSNDIIDVLKEINSIKPLWVELGLQTIHQNTADYIRRGYPLSDYVTAATKLRQAGIKVITHLIIGLPYEDKNLMVESAKFAGKYSDGVKFHMLYIVKNTDLAQEYVDGNVNILSLDEYIDILCECIRVIPEDVVIHRLSSEAEKESLLAPLWSSDKIKVLREIKNAMYDRDVIQGENI